MVRRKELPQADHAENLISTPNVNGHVAFLTSTDLIEEVMLFLNVYSVNFRSPAKAQSSTVQVPYFTPELESLALSDFEISNKKIQKPESDDSISYPRIRCYLVSLFDDNAETSLENFSALSKAEKHLIHTSIQHLWQQIKENSCT